MSDDEIEDEIKVSTDPALRPAAIRQAAILVSDLYVIDVTFDGRRDVPRGEYTHVLFAFDNPLACTALTGSGVTSFGWEFTEEDVPEILEQADVMIGKWTAAGEQWGVSGEDEDGPGMTTKEKGD